MRRTACFKNNMKYKKQKQKVGRRNRVKRNIDNYKKNTNDSNRIEKNNNNKNKNINNERRNKYRMMIMMMMILL